MDEKEAEARPLMGTIFLVISIHCIMCIHTQIYGLNKSNEEERSEAI